MSRGKALTADLVVSKTKSDSLHNIKNLNLWGNDLEDLKLLREMTNLEVVSLSVNRISSLKEFAHLRRLQELYLRKNNIQDLGEIGYLSKLPELKVLWLHDNPCANSPSYRQTVIRALPGLLKLDNTVITQEERAGAGGQGESEEEPERGSSGGAEKAKVDSPYREQREVHREQQHYQGREQYQELERPATGKVYRDQNDDRPLNGGRPVTQQQRNKWQPRQDPRSNIYPKQPRQDARSNIYHPPPPPATASRQPAPRRDARQRQPPRQPHPQLPQPQPQAHNTPSFEDMQRNKNILMAIVSLMRELDENSLEVVRGEVERLTGRR